MNIKDIREEIELHIKRIDAILPEIIEWLPLDNSSFEKTEIVKTIDSFIYRFTKIQDKMGEKLFPAVLQILQEYKTNMPLIDVLNKLEQLELIESTDEWIEYRKLRNTITHEYPGNEKEIIESINLAIDVYKKMIKIYKKLILSKK